MFNVRISKAFRGFIIATFWKKGLIFMKTWENWGMVGSICQRRCNRWNIIVWMLLLLTVRRSAGKLWTSLCHEIRTCVWRRMRKLQGTLLFHCKLEGCMECLQLWFPSTLSVWALWVTDWRRVWRSWVCLMLKMIPKLLPSLELPISWKRSPVFKATGQ